MRGTVSSLRYPESFAGHARFRSNCGQKLNLGPTDRCLTMTLQPGKPWHVPYHEPDILPGCYLVRVIFITVIREAPET